MNGLFKIFSELKGFNILSLTDIQHTALVDWVEVASRIKGFKISVTELSDLEPVMGVISYDKAGNLLRTPEYEHVVNNSLLVFSENSYSDNSFNLLLLDKFNKVVLTNSYSFKPQTENTEKVIPSEFIEFLDKEFNIDPHEREKIHLAMKTPRKVEPPVFMQKYEPKKPRSVATLKETIEQGPKQLKPIDPDKKIVRLDKNNYEQTVLQKLRFKLAQHKNDKFFRITFTNEKLMASSSIAAYFRAQKESGFGKEIGFSISYFNVEQRNFLLKAIISVLEETHPNQLATKYKLQDEVTIEGMSKALLERFKDSVERSFVATNTQTPESGRAL